LWSAWGVHFGWNLTLGVLFGARTSGFGFEGRILEMKPTEEGIRSPLLSGGDYGPEASLLLLPLLLATTLVLRTRWRPSYRGRDGSMTA
jgi:hypothetical protein